MFARNKRIFLMALGAVALWVALFYALVVPQWAQRESEIRAAQEHLGLWRKYYQAAPEARALPAAARELDHEERGLAEALTVLKQIEIGRDMQGFALSAAEGGDPMNYLDTLRRKVLSAARSRYAIRLAPGLDDLGLRGDLAKNRKDVPLNLARLFALERFLAAAKEANVTEVLAIRFPKPGVVPAAEAEKAEVERLLQVPLVVQFRAPERNFAPLLCELQRPTDKTRFYLCPRGFQVGVKDASSGMVEASVAVGALMPVSQAKELELEVKEEEREEGPERPSIDPRGAF